MGKLKTNLFEIVLREVLVGKTIYDKDGQSFVIESLNYDPTVRCAYISDGVKKAKIKVDDYFDYEFVAIPDNTPRALPGNASKFRTKN